MHVGDGAWTVENSFATRCLPNGRLEPFDPLFHRQGHFVVPQFPKVPGHGGHSQPCCEPQSPGLETLAPSSSTWLVNLLKSKLSTLLKIVLSCMKGCLIQGRNDAPTGLSHDQAHCHGIPSCRKIALCLIYIIRKIDAIIQNLGAHDPDDWHRELREKFGLG